MGHEVVWGAGFRSPVFGFPSLTYGLTPVLRPAISILFHELTASWLLGTTIPHRHPEATVAKVPMPVVSPAISLAHVTPQGRC